MRKLTLTLTAAAACTWAGALTNPAEATVLTGPQGLAAAADELQITDQVHCRPGWRHHRGGGDGCYRRYRPRAYYYPGPYYGYGGPYYGSYGHWGPRRYWGGPGIQFRFGF